MSEKNNQSEVPQQTPTESLLIAALKVYSVTFITLYLIFSFILAEFDFTQWGYWITEKGNTFSVRFGFILIWFSCTTISVGIYKWIRYEFY